MKLNLASVYIGIEIVVTGNPDYHLVAAYSVYLGMFHSLESDIHFSQEYFLTELGVQEVRFIVVGQVRSH